MKDTRAKIDKGGRLVIPARYRQASGLKPGDEVVLTLEEREMRIISTRQAIKQAQRLVRQYVPKGRNLSEELIRERREWLAMTRWIAGVEVITPARHAVRLHG